MHAWPVRESAVGTVPGSRAQRMQCQCIATSCILCRGPVGGNWTNQLPGCSSTATHRTASQKSEGVLRSGPLIVVQAHGNLQLGQPVRFRPCSA